MANSVPYLVQSLVVAKSIRNCGNKQHIVLIFIPQQNKERLEDAERFISSNQEIIDSLNIQILHINEPPCSLKHIKNTYYKNLITKSIRHTAYLYKLYPWSLTQYKKVLFLDSDMLVRKNLDHLFEKDCDFLYSDGPASPLNAGMFLAKPCDLTFKALRNMLLEGDFSYDKGWRGLGRTHEFFNAIETDQGLLYYFFIKDKFKGVVHKVERKLYNNQTPFDIFDLVKYKDHKKLEHLIDPKDVVIVHFSGWGQLYDHNGGKKWDDPSFKKVKINNKIEERIKVPFHQEWLNTRNSLNLSTLVIQ